jgi:hypothetical protein
MRQLKVGQFSLAGALEKRIINKELRLPELFEGFTYLRQRVCSPNQQNYNHDAHDNPQKQVWHLTFHLLCAYPVILVLSCFRSHAPRFQGSHAWFASARERGPEIKGNRK